MVFFFVVVVCSSGAEDWVTLPHEDICAVNGSTVVMPCTFTHPAGLIVKEVFWLIHPKDGIEPTDLNLTESYKGRVQYFWNKDKNCTMELSKVEDNDSKKYYVRIKTNNETMKWQSKSAVHLTVTGTV